jgi:hypothetical protein
MQRKPFEMFMLIAVTFGLIVVPGRCYAAEDHHEPGQHEGAHTNETIAVKAGTVGELWRAVKTEEAELGKLIKARDLEKVHEVAFSIRDRVAALPEKSTQLSGEQMAQLKANVKYVTTLAERLDKAGDSKDQAATEASLRQLQSVLGNIEKLYAPEALK